MPQRQLVHKSKGDRRFLRSRDRLYHPIEGFKIMPQTITTVTSCVKPVEELRSVEISFEDHEFYAGQKLVASITHDDDLTQPWIVMVNGEEIHRANTFKRCHSYITWHYQRGTLPIQEEETPVATTGNEIMVQIADECEKYGFEILSDGIYDQDRKLGEVGCTNSRWWVIRATSVHQQKIPCDSAFDAVWVLSIVELTQPSREELLDKPFDRLTANDRNSYGNISHPQTSLLIAVNSQTPTWHG
ncbi:hypothetical protein FD723_33255 (plasmid) [Nostoc sp. C052]|uniref:hypothetical protein n=1 Tax=Nostoc sp. C052 TaxID=2576902 RepID=UPI0015C30A32|nr:hypothetical protein [Nostoc sp. C052]QLE45192.1 hypothetical protein FD723_33255 [Nostoc sp. C052]